LFFPRPIVCTRSGTINSETTVFPAPPLWLLRTENGRDASTKTSSMQRVGADGVTQSRDTHISPRKCLLIFSLGVARVTVRNALQCRSHHRPARANSLSVQLIFLRQLPLLVSTLGL